MDISPGLISKGAAGLATASAATGAGIYYKDDIFSYFNPTITETLKTPEQEILEKIGLDCFDNENCLLKNEKILNVKEGENKKTGVTSLTTSNGGKIKLHKGAADYKDNLKFSIEGGNITLNGGAGGNFTELAQGSTYEMFGEGGTWFLSKKTPAPAVESERDKKVKSLSLPAGCNLPTDTNNSVTCQNLTLSQVMAINFADKGAGISPTSTTDNFTLKIEKVIDDAATFTVEGLRFTFENVPEDVSNSSGTIILKKGTNPEFKIEDDGSSWSLKKAWNPKTLAEKINLICPESGETGDCNFGNTQTSTNVSDSSNNKLVDGKIQGGKIKFEKDRENYNQGFKFTVEENDIDLTEGTSSGSGVSKLLDGATYEIKFENSKWFFVKKSDPAEEYLINKKLKLLGLDGCEFKNNETSINCNVASEAAIKKINFDGKGSGNINVTGGSSINLTVEKITSSNNVFGADKLKFTFKPTSSISISGGAKTISLRKGTKPEFKIKNESGNLSLERVWNIMSLAGKINLDCSSSAPGECTLKSSKKINVFVDNNNYVIDADIQDKINKKITYEEDQEGYNQGFKFTVAGDIDLNGGNVTKSGNENIKITNNSSATYEIKKQTIGGSNQWFLSKKN